MPGMTNPIAITLNGTIYKFSTANNFTTTSTLPGGPGNVVRKFRVFSPTFGFVVGGTGDYTNGFTPKIWKYDGTKFTAMTLPAGLTGALAGVYVLSNTKAWAVGDGGERQMRIWWLTRSPCLPSTSPEPAHLLDHGAWRCPKIRQVGPVLQLATPTTGKG